MATFGAPASGTGSREPSPAVSALTGFDQAHGSIRQIANILDSFTRMDRALISADEILRDIKENHLA
jgi:hypothetical protein